MGADHGVHDIAFGMRHPALSRAHQGHAQEPSRIAEGSAADVLIPLADGRRRGTNKVCEALRVPRRVTPSVVAGVGPPQSAGFCVELRDMTSTALRRWVGARSTKSRSVSGSPASCQSSFPTCPSRSSQAPVGMRIASHARCGRSHGSRRDGRPCEREFTAAPRYQARSRAKQRTERRGRPPSTSAPSTVTGPP